jgi:glutamate racemase
MSKQPIGIFDSGLGGLTVLRELRRRLPREHFIYFGDTANVPYGSKSKQTVTLFSLAIARFLEQEKHAKAIVVACNTASAQALNALKKHCHIPVFSVIEPGAERAIQATHNGHIAILGTEGTVRSKAYEKALYKLNPKVRITAKSCPLFVPLVEEGWERKPATRLIAQEYLAPIRKSQADTVILGCTHYPLLREQIVRILGKRVRLINPAEALAKKVQETLPQSTHAETAGKGSMVLFSSDDPARFKQLAQLILAENIPAVHLKKLNV